ncbi:hypothetical protein HDC94_000882 [Leifsonia sp. AK011]|uniref:hypothetical protein n=1 Tax=Leifsonia sp. AK011 TaxID=2723075 RepID=UPI0015CDEBCA|nr:hypothetical protein [Leifsonia sp. AK011]NYF09726.1 hypothetical protein [Leifsonia sp. AK011]
MRTLLNDEFAPITKAIGFVKAGIDEVTDQRAQFLQQHGYTLSRRELALPLIESLRVLEPLTVGARPRTLWVEHGTWTACFDSGYRGGDPGPGVSLVARSLAVDGLYIRTSPDIRGGEVRRWGATQFVFYPAGGDRTHTRVVAATNDGSWVWQNFGEPLPFEEVERYEAPRRRDRFTSDMLERYCQALGIDVFNAEAYGPRAVLLEMTELRGKPLTYRTMTLEEAQAANGIVPGQAAAARG